MPSRKETWLITGGAGILGSAMVQALMRQGADCLAIDKDFKGLEALDDACQAEGIGRPALYPMDLSGATLEDMETLAQTVEKEIGHLNHIVHAANSFVASRPLMHQPPQEWMQITQTAVHAPLFLTKALIPILSSNEAASITWVIDEVCLSQPAHWGAYGMSQAARKWIAEALAAEVGPKGPSVNALGTPDFLSPIRQQAWPAHGQSHYPVIGPIADALIEQIRQLSQRHKQDGEGDHGR